jgi:hypothetical protein
MFTCFINKNFDKDLEKILCHVNYYKKIFLERCYNEDTLKIFNFHFNYNTQIGLFRLELSPFCMNKDPDPFFLQNFKILEIESLPENIEERDLILYKIQLDWNFCVLKSYKNENYF